MRRDRRSSRHPRRLFPTRGAQLLSACSIGRGDRTEPYLDRPVGPPRSPRLGPSGCIATQGAPESEVGRGERVALTAGPHCDVVRGPGPESGQGLERGEGVVKVSGPIQLEVTGCDRYRERVDGTSSRSGQPDVGEVGAGQGGGVGEEVGETERSDAGYGASVALDEAAGQLGCGAHRYLLAEDGSHAHFERVDRARNPYAASGTHHWPERPIAGERGVDHGRIG